MAVTMARNQAGVLGCRRQPPAPPGGTFVVAKVCLILAGLGTGPPAAAYPVGPDWPAGEAGIRSAPPPAPLPPAASAVGSDGTAASWRPWGPLMSDGWEPSLYLSPGTCHRCFHYRDATLWFWSRCSRFLIWSPNFVSVAF